MQHFFVEDRNFHGDVAYITGEDVHHISRVLRLSPGDELLISSGLGDYIACIEAVTKDEIRLSVGDREETKELPVRVVLCQALTKSDKMELVIQKAVELGAFSIIPYISSRVIVKLDKEKYSNKLLRWNKLSESAAKQSKRSIVPKVADIRNFESLLAELEDYDYKFLAYENARGLEHSRACLDSIDKNSDIAILIGPEGGFEDREVELAKNYGFEVISLGRRILRTETAGFVLLSNIMFRLDD